MKRLYVTSFPRTRGDEPCHDESLVPHLTFSPHARG